MRCFTIIDTRAFMSALFTNTTFDKLSVEKIRIVTANTYEIDGRIVPEFFSREEKDSFPDGLPDFSLWEQLRPLCFSIIKGKKTPVSFQTTLHAPHKLLLTLCAHENCMIPPEKVQALVCTIRYSEGVCRLITGSSYTTFLPDKSLDTLWDNYFSEFLSSQAISFETE